MSASSASAEKTERLLNLILALKSARRPIPKDKLRSSLPAYAEAPSDEAFDRMFERDKDELREMGIPITTTVVDVLFDDEVGYRIDSSETSLPEISFEPDEVAALALAARAWSTASISGTATAALRKLRLAGVEIDESLAAGVEPRIRTTESAFDPVHAAVLARQPIIFDYRKNDGSVSTRHVRPWALKHWHGRWYLTGHDVDRGAERAFRLGRVVGPVRRKGRAGSYEVPADHVPEVSLAAQAAEPEGTAVVRLRHGRGHALRQAAGTTRDIDHEWGEVELPYERGRTERDVAALGRHAVAVSPPELVEGVRTALARTIAAHGGHGVRADVDSRGSADE
ncbi:helix-turn-helix transcriptional regulator [Intrasporangium sp.]|uniref:helix-turn-helix transcriptional regulator n=1 Tax=Intrasporangium sp. TaxID=1925024 RepID=UPI00293AA781|nr:WYL domain-containing protein [Intrasporangium sp.]MDV3222115.1 WYL domain-containing protein [Intrasporangium sp.]